MLFALMLLLAFQSPREGSVDPSPATTNNGVSLMPGSTRLAYINGLPVLGTVVFPDDIPQHFIEIELEAEDGTVVDSTKSGPGGRFRFNNVKLGNYYFVITGDGFRPVRQLFQLNTGSFGSANVNIVLRAAGKPSDWEMLVAAARLNNNIHKDAIKAFENAGEAQSKGDERKFGSEMEKALKIAPDFYEANLELGLHYQRQGDRERAAQLLVHAIDLNAASVSAYTALGEIYYETEQFQKSVDSLREAAKLGNTSANLYFTLGSAYYRLADLKEAELNLLRAIAISPETMKNAHLQLHNVFMRGRQPFKALEQLDIYLEKFPDASDREEMQSRADKLRKDLSRFPPPPGK